MDELDQFLDQFYQKYSPDNIPQGERRASLKQKLSSDFEGYVGQMYQKYAPDSVPDSARMANLKSKYVKAAPVVEVPVESPEAPVEEKPSILSQAANDIYSYTLKPLVEAGKAIGKTVYSGFTDTVPQTVEQTGEVIESAINPTNIDEFIRTKKPADFQRFVREKEGLPWYKPFGEEGYKTYLPKYGKAYMETHGFGEDVTRMEKNLPKVIERRKALEEYVAQQKEEAKQKTEGVVQDFRDISDLSDLTSYIGGLAGQAAYQIPVSVGTRGASSYIMEAASVYDKQLDRLAKENGITREQVIERGLDKPAMGQSYAIAAAALDATNAGNLIGAFRKAGGSLLKKYLVNAGSEGVTEAAQGALEDVGAGNSVEDAFTGEGLAARLNELAGGAVGGTIFSFNGKDAHKQEADKAINDIADTGDPSLNAQIDAEAALSPKQEELLKTKLAETKLEETKEIEDKLVKEEEKNAESVRKDEGQVPESGTSTEAGESQSRENIQQQAPEESSNEENKVESFDQTPKYKAADEKIKSIAEQVRVNPTAENAKALNEAIQERDNARIAFEQKPSRKPRQEKSIKMTPSEAIKFQVQNFYRGVEEGVRKGQKMTNEQLVSKVQEAIKDSPLQPNQISSILTKVKKTNLFTPGSISKLNDYIDRVSTDANYAQSVQDATSLQSKIKKLGKSKVTSIPQPYKSAAKKLGKIDPSSVEDVEKYKELAESVNNAFLPVTKEGYKPLNVKTVTEFVKVENERQKQKQYARLREQFGFEPDEFTDEELDRLFNAEGQDLDEFVDNRDEGRKIIARDKIQRAAEYSKLGAQGIDLSEFEPADAKVIKSLADAPIADLSDAQLVEYVRAVDNVLENGEMSNAANVEAQIEAVKAFKELDEKVNKDNLGKIGAFKSSLYSIPNLFKAIYSDSKIASAVQSLSGIQDVFNGGSRVEGEENKFLQAFDDKAREIRKKYGKNVKSAETQSKLGVFSQLVRYKGDPEKSLAKSKANIEESIKRLKTDKKWKDMAKDAEDAYSQFKDIETIDEIIAKLKATDPAAYEMWAFINRKFATEVRPKLKANTEQGFNEEFVDEENYAGQRRSVNIDPTQGDFLKVTTDPASTKRGSKPKQASTSIVSNNRLANGKALDFRFYENAFEGFKDSMYNIETARARKKVYEFLRLPGVERILGGMENKRRVAEVYEKAEAVQRGFGREYGTMSRLLDEITSILRTLGYTASLGSWDQFIKQYFPVASNTLWNLGTDSGLFFSHIPEGANKLFEMHTIGQRGRRQGGVERGESIKYSLQSAYRNKLLKAVNKVHKASEKGSSLFMYSLTKGDVSVAQRSWVAYYLKSLKKAGVDLKTVDLSTEHEKQDEKVRKEAAAYAEQMVKETQVVSNSAELASALRTAPGAESWIKNIFIPFSTFAVNTKVRLIENFRQLKTADDKGAAWRALAGTLSEVTLYSAIKYLLLSQVYNLMKAGIENVFDLEPDDKDDSDGLIRKLYSAIYKDLSPVSIGSLGEKATTEFGNFVSWLVQNPDASYEEWKKETKGGTFYQYEDKSGMMDLGLYSVALKRIQDTINDVNASLTGNSVVTTPWGEKEVELDDDQQKFVGVMVMFDFLSSAGLMDASLYNQMRRVYNEQQKSGNSESNGTPTIAPRPRPRPLPRPLPRPNPR